MDFIIVNTTFTDKAEALDVAEKLLRKRLIACAQISKEIDSIYWWKDSIEKSTEYLLSMKTRDNIYPDLEKYLKEIHSYETPEIVALPIHHIEDDYQKWLVNETNSKDL